MNIQPVNVNQNRPQNFGINFKVLAKSDAKPAQSMLKTNMQEIVQLIPRDLRGELTNAMRQAKDKNILVFPQGDYYLLKPELGDCDYPSLTPSVELWHGFLRDGSATPESKASLAKNAVENMLEFIKAIISPSPEARTTKAVMAEMNFIA